MPQGDVQVSCWLYKFFLACHLAGEVVVTLMSHFHSKLVNLISPNIVGGQTHLADVSMVAQNKVFETTFH
jgi:hypothetical protein